MAWEPVSRRAPCRSYHLDITNLGLTTVTQEFTSTLRKPMLKKDEANGGNSTKHGRLPSSARTSASVCLALADQQLVGDFE